MSVYAVTGLVLALPAGVIMVGQKAGMLIGPLLFGTLVEATGSWTQAYASLPVICFLALLAGWRARRPLASGGAYYA